MSSFPRVLMVAALAVLAAVPSWAMDAPISGRKLTLRDTPSPKLVLVSRAAIVGPTLTGSDDPTFFGATLQVTSMGGETETVDLPAAGWSASGGGVFRFRNTTAPAGISPVRTVIITPGRRLKILSKTPVISLNEPSQGSVSVVLQSGTLRYCATFGGTVTLDTQGKFKRADARRLPAAADHHLHQQHQHLEHVRQHVAHPDDDDHHDHVDHHAGRGLPAAGAADGRHRVHDRPRHV